MAEKERKEDRKRKETRCLIQAMYKDAKKAIIRLTDLDRILK